MILTLVLSSVLVIGSPAESVNFEVVVPVAEDVALLIFEAEPCERISEIVEELRADSFAVYCVDVNSNSNLARQCQVWEAPHWVMLITGHAWQQMSGCQSAQVLRSWFREAAAESEGTRIKPSAERVDNPFGELREANLEKEYAAPIPDSLIGYEVHDLSGLDGNPVRILLEKPVADEVLARLDGPAAHSLPGCNCLMCVGNHLIQIHGQAETYLRQIGFDAWPACHNNQHNDPSLAGAVEPGEGYIGYEAGGGYSSRRGLLGRIFRRSRE